MLPLNDGFYIQDKLFVCFSVTSESLKRKHAREYTNDLGDQEIARKSYIVTIV